MKVQLTVIEGKHQGLSIPLRRSSFVIGRDPGCQLRPKNEEIDAQHCSLSVGEDHLAVLDLGSRLGTWVNGRRIQPRKPVAAYHGDRLQVGNLVFEVKIDEGQDKSSGSSLADELDDNSLSALANRLIQKNLGLGSDPVKGVGLHLQSKMVEGVPVVTILMTRVVDEAQLLPFGRELRDLAERPKLNRLILDFHHVKEFSREAAEKLLAFHERVAARGTSLKFCEVAPNVLRRLEKARVTDLVSVHLDVTDALWSSWQGRSRGFAVPGPA